MKTISQVILLRIAREFRLMYYRDISFAYQEHSGRTKDERCFGVIFRRCFFLFSVLVQRLLFWHTLNFLGNRNRLVSAFSESAEF